MTQLDASAEGVVPFRVRVADEDLAELGERLRRTRWPAKEPVRDWP